MSGLNVIAAVLLAGAAAAPDRSAAPTVPSAVIGVVCGPTCPNQGFYDPMPTGPGKWTYDPMPTGPRQRIYDPMPVWPGLMDVQPRKIIKMFLIQADVK
jgi:hypothetical protein